MWHTEQSIIIMNNNELTEKCYSVSLIPVGTIFLFSQSPASTSCRYQLKVGIHLLLLTSPHLCHRQPPRASFPLLAKTVAQSVAQSTRSRDLDRLGSLPLVWVLSPVFLQDIIRCSATRTKCFKNAEIVSMQSIKATGSYLQLLESISLQCGGKDCTFTPLHLLNDSRYFTDYLMHQSQVEFFFLDLKERKSMRSKFQKVMKIINATHVDFFQNSDKFVCSDFK